MIKKYHITEIMDKFFEENEELPKEKRTGAEELQYYILSNLEEG